MKEKAIYYSADSKYDKKVTQSGNNYLNTILKKSEKYLKEGLDTQQYKEFICRIQPLYRLKNVKQIVSEFERLYYSFIKEIYQNSYP